MLCPLSILAQEGGSQNNCLQEKKEDFFHLMLTLVPTAPKQDATPEGGYGKDARWRLIP
jgi:hypothetical protein